MSGVADEPGSEQVYLLEDHAVPKRCWRVHVRRGAVVLVEQAGRKPGEVVDGVLDHWALAGKKTVIAFLSSARHDSYPEVPGYAKDFRILVDGRLLGDGGATPRLQFQRGFFAREFVVQADDGWRFRARYKAPWLRELVRKFNVGHTLDYEPVDFIERLIDMVGAFRKQWLPDTH